MLSSKACGTCGEEKPVGEFNKRTRSKDGYQAKCRACQIVHKRETLAANPERQRAFNREDVARWRKRNPEKAREHRRAANHRRRARKRGATPEMFTAAELFALWVEVEAWACVYCGAPFEHVDHVQPLARGGDHALWNLVPSCAACNLAKSDRDPYEFLRSRGVPGL